MFVYQCVFGDEADAEEMLSVGGVFWTYLVEIFRTLGCTR